MLASLASLTLSLVTSSPKISHHSHPSIAQSAVPRRAFAQSSSPLDSSSAASSSASAFKTLPFPFLAGVLRCFLVGVASSSSPSSATSAAFLPERFLLCVASVVSVCLYYLPNCCCCLLACSKRKI